MPHIRDELPGRMAFHRQSLCQCCGVKHLALGLGVEPDVCVSYMDGVAVDIELLLFRRNPLDNLRTEDTVAPECGEVSASALTMRKAFVLNQPE